MADQKQFNGVVNFKNTANFDGAIQSTAGITATTGDVTVTAGNLDVVAGDINLTNGRRFFSACYYGLTLVAKTDSQTNSGFSLADGQLVEAAWEANSSCAIALPAATKGALCVFRIVAQADGGENAVFTAAGSDLFAAQTLMLNTINVADSFLGHTVKPQSTAGTAFSGGTNVTANGSSNNILTLSCPGTNNQTNAGAQLAFYCAEAGKWLVSFRGSELGTGASAGVLAFSG